MTDERSTIPDGLVAMLDLLAQTIVQALGFGVGAVNLACRDGSFEVVSVAGDDAAREVLVGTVDRPEVWDRVLGASEEWGRLRFLDHRQDTGDLYDWVPDITPLDVTGAWHPEDALFALLIAEDGSRLGILSVDLPHDGRRPNAATRSALEAFAVSAALAIEHATLRQRAEASEAAFRHQATHDQHGAGEPRPAPGPAGARAHRPLQQRLGDGAGLRRHRQVQGHQRHALPAAGDAVIDGMAAQIRSVVRPHDTVARWGGDEFLVLLNQLPDESTVLDVVQRMSTAVAKPVVVNGHVIEATASMGVCLWPSDKAEHDADELIRRADTAMYSIKGSGRNGYAVFSPMPAD